MIIKKVLCGFCVDLVIPAKAGIQVFFLDGRLLKKSHDGRLNAVIPANAGIQTARNDWIPASAGMTV